MSTPWRRPLLESPEYCPECGCVYLTSMTVRECEDHEGKEAMMVPAREDGEDEL